MPSSRESTELEDQKKLQLCIAEFEFVWTQLHQRMSGVSSLISLSAAFFAFAVGFVISNIEIANSDHKLLFITSFTIPFFVIGSLIAREDLFMQSHDTYIIDNLRPRMLKLSGFANDPNADDVLTFVYSMDELKTGSGFMFLGIARYLFALLGLLFVLIVVFINGPTPASGTWWACFLWTSFWIFVLLLMLQAIGKRADRNFASKNRQALHR